MSERPIVLLGGGGHARVVHDLLMVLGLRIAGVASPTAPDLPAPYLGPDEAVLALDRGAVALANGLGGAAAPARRAELHRRFAAAGFDFPALVHPRAVVAHDVVLGPGTQVMAGAVVQAGTRLGAGCLVNSGAVVDHDGRLEDHVHIAPGATVCGGVALGEATFVGAGAVVLQGLRIGAGCLIAAGATVTRSLGDGLRVAGTPAEPLGMRGPE